jgi:hypothetical protein
MTAQIATADDLAAVHAELRAIRERLDVLAPPREWVGVATYAAMIGVSKTTVYRKIKSGELQTRGNGKTREVKV